MYDTFQYYRSVPCLFNRSEADWAVKGSCKAQGRGVEVGRLRYIAFLGNTIEKLIRDLENGTCTTDQLKIQDWRYMDQILVEAPGYLSLRLMYTCTKATLNKDDMKASIIISVVFLDLL